jgi:hypothetical protein
VVLYGCETWSLILREENRLRVFENRVLRKISGTKRDEVIEGWRKLHNEELHNLYCSPSIIRIIKSRMRWAGQVARMGAKRKAYRILVGKPEGKRPLGRPTRRWEDNIRMDLREIGRGGMDWIDLAQNRDQWRALVNTVMNLRVPYNVGKFLSGCPTGSFSRRAQLHGVSYMKYSIQSEQCSKTCFKQYLPKLFHHKEEGGRKGKNNVNRREKQKGLERNIGEGTKVYFNVSANLHCCI